MTPSKEYNKRPVTGLKEMEIQKCSESYKRTHINNTITPKTIQEENDSIKIWEHKKQT